MKMMCKGKTYIKGICDKCNHQPECNPIRKLTKNERIENLERQALTRDAFYDTKIKELEEEHKAIIRLLPTRVREIMGVPTKILSSKKIHAIANDHAKRGRPKKE